MTPNKETRRPGAVGVREEMETMVAGLEADGYYEFPATGNVISNYIYTKSVALDSPLTYDADESDPTQYPGWRGQTNNNGQTNNDGQTTIVKQRTMVTHRWSNKQRW